MIQLISTITGIILVVLIARFSLHLSKQFDKLRLKVSAQGKQIQALQSTVQRQRKQIADYLNELTKNRQ